MYGLRRFGIILGLSTIRNILKKLGNPQNRFNIIHVAGTNGKGSVAATLSSILHAAGYRVGLYTSPHLVRFNERICVNNRQISNEGVVEAYYAVKAVHHGRREPTFFEYSTAMAFYEFGKRHVDWAVIETGMGGRLDATNIVKPIVSIITNISLEHRIYLGNTVAQIATEKGGIIKNKVPVVTGVKQKQALDVLKAIASAKSAPFYKRGEAFRVKKNSDGTFTYFGRKITWRNLKTALTGFHQIDNAALALAACEVLCQKGTNLTISAIKKGLIKTRWPGRLEVARKTPLVLLDGAHNFIAARTLRNYLSQQLKNRNITMVIGILDDKPYKSMLQCLLTKCYRVIITQPKTYRALPTETLYGVAKRIVPNTEIISNVAEAVKYAIETSSAQDAVCVAGSLYVVGEAKAWLDENTNDA
ncbi:MAG: bifunctional folylpolyglutamate synthase/dihydrofolate synthase [Deltaproteobacteria bacterium]|nr:bifunctional folylpolyglutamate synthase/dihydrofolate synthase [Deltaproteobacteria bacterium]MBW1994788.1 bifunctional folylpolyglutamate synthase/dihydrofolate synthase [Deltaproteobacteria bacterium]MBW2151455.1 bifunctional folylpolyglutamate synthase/dihydrofolate synthase [Deltaproteobacteria bacterium]